MPIEIHKSKLLPPAYLPLVEEAKKKRINTLGFRVNIPGIKSTGGEPFFFKFPRYSDKSILNLDEVIKTFGDAGYEVARKAHKLTWGHLLPESGAIGNFIVNADPKTVRIESDNCVVVNGLVSSLKEITLKDCDGSFVFECEGLRVSSSPGSAFVSVSDSEFDRSPKTSAIHSTFLDVDKSGRSRYSKSGRSSDSLTGKLTVTNSPGSAFHRVYNSSVENSPSFTGKHLDNVIVKDTKSAGLTHVSNTSIDKCEGIKATDCSDIDSITLSPFTIVSRTHSISKIGELPKREIVEGKVLPSGFSEKIPWWLGGTAAPVLVAK